MAHVYQFFCVVTVISTLMSCGDRNGSLSISIKKSFVSHAVSSGSALAVDKDSIVLVGDDAEYVAKLPVNDTQFRRISMYPNAPQNRIDKSVKHDLESCVTGSIDNEPYIFAFGSGGESPYRDTLFVFNTNDTGKNFRKSLLPLYEHIRSKTGLRQEELNIEGAAKTRDKLYLFNRGKNFLVSISWEDFIGFLKNENTTTIPPLSILNVSLPIVNKFPVGFSGACSLNDRQLLFTASLEETTDFTEDGAIKGSYIGMLEINNSQEINLLHLSKLQDEKSNDINEKLESIDIIRTGGKYIEAVAVSDNDKGNSKLFYLAIKRP